MINFPRYSADYISAITSEIKNETLKKLEQITACRNKPEFENTLLAFDEMFGELNNELYPIYLLANAAEDEKVRETANAAVLELSNFADELSLNEDLYRALTNFESSEEARTLNGAAKRLLKKSIEDFERNGFKLSSEEREKLKTLRFRLNDLENRFQQNIAEHQYELFISENEAQGLPEYYKKERRQADGTYRITLDMPTYMPLMRYAQNSDLRKKIYYAYLNRAADKNPELLQEILKLRQEQAALLGFPSYAAYVVEDKMSGTPETVWNFENNLKQKVKPKAVKDLQELVAFRDEINPELRGQKFNAWDLSFWSNLLLEQKYKVDSLIVQEYFELNNVFEGVFRICEKLFGIRIEKAELPKWHDEVQTFLLKEGEKTLANFYLDNFPRKGKYSHAACFGLGKGKNLYQGDAVKSVALVCNFPRPSEERPSLLTFGQVTTVFHEFGHLLHKTLSESRFYSFAGTSVARDFVEVPSQFFESWCNHYDALTLFAKHYRTGEILPKDLFDKMQAAKNVGSGLQTLQQILYGTFDFYLHDVFQPEGELSIGEAYQKLYEDITLFEFAEGTCFHASFGHLMGYAASYYGYLWSLVFAEDMFSVFEEKGIFSREAGMAFRKEVLAKGNDLDAKDIIRNFLGREPSETAFLRSIGLH